jgi:hypothetical protein
MFLSSNNHQPSSTKIAWLTPDSFHYWQVQGVCQHLFPVDQYRFPINTINDSQEHIAAVTRRGAVMLSGRLAPFPSECSKCYYHISRLVAVKFYSEHMLNSLLVALIERAKNIGADGLMVHVKMQSLATYLQLGFTKVVAFYDNVDERPLHKMFLKLD